MNSFPLKNARTGIIYTITSQTLKSIYIGSTFVFNKRKSGHLQQVSPNFKGTYCTSLPIVQQSDHQFNIIEEIPVSSKRQLDKREGYYQRNYSGHYNLVNKMIAGRSKKRYRADMKSYINERFDCNDCGGSYTRTNKSHHIKCKKHLDAINNKENIFVI